jgi:hypothetical protein
VKPFILVIAALALTAISAQAQATLDTTATTQPDGSILAVAHYSNGDVHTTATNIVTTTQDADGNTVYHSNMQAGVDAKPWDGVVRNANTAYTEDYSYSTVTGDAVMQAPVKAVTTITAEQAKQNIQDRIQMDIQTKKDVAQYEANIKSGKWKAFKNGE